MNPIYLNIDRFLIFFYRLHDIPIVGYLIGTFFLAFLCGVLGQLTLSFAYYMNNSWVKNDGDEMIRMHNLSMFALKAKDKTAYTACNKAANDAFGKFFFGTLALGISSLWPVFFGMAWMQERFGSVEFTLPVRLPLISDSVGFAFSFIPLYILVCIGLTHVRKRLGFLKFLEFRKEKSEALIGFNDIFGCDTK